MLGHTCLYIRRFQSQSDCVGVRLALPARAVRSLARCGGLPAALASVAEVYDATDLLRTLCVGWVGQLLPSDPCRWGDALRRLSRSVALGDDVAAAVVVEVARTHARSVAAVSAASAPLLEQLTLLLRHLSLRWPAGVDEGLVVLARSGAGDDASNADDGVVSVAWVTTAVAGTRNDVVALPAGAGGLGGRAGAGSLPLSFAISHPSVVVRTAAIARAAALAVIPATWTPAEHGSGAGPADDDDATPPHAVADIGGLILSGARSAATDSDPSLACAGLELVATLAQSSHLSVGAAMSIVAGVVVSWFSREDGARPLCTAAAACATIASAAKAAGDDTVRSECVGMLLGLILVPAIAASGARVGGGSALLEAATAAAVSVQHPMFADLAAAASVKDNAASTIGALAIAIFRDVAACGGVLAACIAAGGGARLRALALIDACIDGHSGAWRAADLCAAGLRDVWADVVAGLTDSDADELVRAAAASPLVSLGAALSARDETALRVYADMFADVRTDSGGPLSSVRFLVGAIARAVSSYPSDEATLPARLERLRGAVPAGDAPAHCGDLLVLCLCAPGYGVRRVLCFLL